MQRTSLAFDGYEKDSELNLPLLLVGPFGTGKTMTFAKILEQICAQFKKSKILAIAPSQSAADTIALKLLSIGIDVNTILRLNHPLRDIYILPWDLMKISCMKVDTFSIPENLLEYSIVICTTVEAQLLVHYGYTNLEIREKKMAAIDDVNEKLKRHGLPLYEWERSYDHWTHLAGL